MKILVAGSLSFVGKNIRRFFSNKDQDVHYVSRAECDLSDLNALSNICKNLQPDLVIHCAVSLNNTHNNLAMYLALERASKYAGRIVMIGSGAEYGFQRYIPEMPETYYDINQPPTNNHPYHTSKFLISRLHQSSSTSNIYNFRVFGLYGPYEDYTRRLISNNIFTFLTEGSMKISANHAFDYLYIDDLINAIMAFAQSSTKPQAHAYNVCNGHADRFFDILTEVISALGGDPSAIAVDSNDLTNTIYSGSNLLFQNEFNYKIHQTSYTSATPCIVDWLNSEVIQP
jgi:UDP-glucose 4-epimerase